MSASATSLTPSGQRRLLRCKVTLIRVFGQADAQGKLLGLQRNLKPNAGTLNIHVRLRDAKAGSRVAVSLRHDDSGTSIPLQWKAVERDGENLIVAAFPSPSGGWPQGKYTVEAFVSGGGKTTHHFEIR